LWKEQVAILVETLKHSRCRAILVSEETGGGVVPMTAAGGRVRDRLGELTQQLTPLCAAAWLVVQGRAVDLTKLSQIVPSP
ncbi:MAG: bifunctional adenosylcobinamide kinase/adenosylcobinamide-phosphate guanylyltransferase, partial [Cyanobacteriota bacterium]